MPTIQHKVIVDIIEHKVLIISIFILFSFPHFATNSSRAYILQNSINNHFNYLILYIWFSAPC